MLAKINYFTVAKQRWYHKSIRELHGKSLLSICFYATTIETSRCKSTHVSSDCFPVKVSSANDDNRLYELRKKLTFRIIGLRLRLGSGVGPGLDLKTWI